MRRAHRWWLGAVGALLALPLLAIAALLWWVDPDSLRPAIEAQVRERLGIELQITGPLQWKLWPAFSVQSGAGALGVEPAAPLLRWQALRFTLRWPRPHDTEWQLDGVVIDGLQMSLQPDAQGRWNIVALFDAVGDSQARAAAPGRTLRIHPLQLRAAELQVRVTPEGSPWQLSRFSMKTDLDRSVDGIWTLAELQLAADVHGGPLPAAEAVTLQTARAVIDPAGSTLRIEPLRARVGDAALQVTAPQPLRWAPLEGEGEMQFDTATLRGWLAAQGVPLPPTRDAAVLRSASLATHWKIAAAQAELSSLQLRLDDTRLQGRIAGRWQTPQDWQVELQGDTLNADRYLRPDSDPGEPFRLPVEALRALPLNGSVRLQRLTAGGAVARDALIELRSTTSRSGPGTGARSP